ncbi:MAG: hypothetical protein BGP05_18680 [Rhizobiales bacterium 62-47]|nr:hypothetical protein [Hyphomicrobiales bacterium]OJY09801.1 MAG: hypothetical protein BGP05_18680 [Rhizobiales bacterium 62-47]
MSDALTSGQPGSASGTPASQDQAVASLNKARRAVEGAIVDVKATSQRFENGASWQARSAAVFVDVLRTSVRAAPLTMLSVAFVAGAMLFSGRRD